jgi:hypothetical protein
LNTVSNKVFLRKLPDATFQEEVLVEYTLYIGLAKDQRIGIWNLPWDAGVGSGRVNL